MTDEVAQRRAYKRGVVSIVPRAYKRPASPPPPEPERPKTKPKWLVEALFSGEVKCPRKWSTLGIEACAQVQERSLGSCAAERCRFVGTASEFAAEVERSKVTGVAPKTTPRSKLALVQDDEDA